MAAIQDEMTKTTRHEGYVGYLLKKIDSQYDYMNYLQTQLQYAQSDKWAYRAAVGGLLAVVVLMCVYWPEGGAA